MENLPDVKSLELNSGTTTKLDPVKVPDYLSKHYWWAYLHPKGLKIFERKWLVDAILWGNYKKLSSAALDELGERVQGRTLQVACVYGSLTPRLVKRLAPEAKLDVIDVAEIQLENLAQKIVSDNLHLARQDASKLEFENNSFNQVLLFFLLHELPLSYRQQALAQAVRVLKPGGRLVIVDYHKPVWSNPLRYLMPVVFKLLEPFALDLWNKEIEQWLPDNCKTQHIQKQTYFGGLYQKLVIQTTQ